MIEALIFWYLQFNVLNNMEQGTFFLLLVVQVSDW